MIEQKIIVGNVNEIKQYIIDNFNPLEKYDRISNHPGRNMIGTSLKNKDDRTLDNILNFKGYNKVFFMYKRTDDEKEILKIECEDYAPATYELKYIHCFIK
jgi:hypothetical protein